MLDTSRLPRLWDNGGAMPPPPPPPKGPIKLSTAVDEKKQKKKLSEAESKLKELFSQLNWKKFKELKGRKTQKTFEELDSIELRNEFANGFKPTIEATVKNLRDMYISSIDQYGMTDEEFQKQKMQSVQKLGQKVMDAGALGTVKLNRNTKSEPKNDSNDAESSESNVRMSKDDVKKFDETLKDMNGKEFKELTGKLAAFKNPTLQQVRESKTVADMINVIGEKAFNKVAQRVGFEVK